MMEGCKCNIQVEWERKPKCISVWKAILLDPRYALPSAMKAQHTVIRMSHCDVVQLYCKDSIPCILVSYGNFKHRKNGEYWPCQSAMSRGGQHYRYRLHNVLQFFQTSIKNCIVENWTNINKSCIVKQKVRCFIWCFGF